MKSVIFIRHAKSSWDSPGMSDFDRPLNERGHRDAPMMAERLLHKEIPIDLFVSSTAKRALSTARYFHKAYKANDDQLMEVPELYHASVETFYAVVEGMKDKYDHVAIFSHNPGITYLVNRLGVAKVDNMPTCGIFGVHAEIDEWKDFQKAAKKFWFFDYPKLGS